MKFQKRSLLLIPIALLSFSVFIEPILLEKTSHSISIGRGQKVLTIGHISDLHTKGIGAVEKKLIDALEQAKPEIIVITGDIATPGGSARGYEEVLSRIKAPLGVYFVQGNWEYWEPIQELAQIFKRQGIRNLTNKTIKLNDDLWIAGLDDNLAGSPNLNVLNEIPETKKIIALFHSPALFESIFDKIDFALAGHSHGGQVRLPFMGPIWTPEGTGEFDAGWYHKGRAKMYVSRGIGNSILPMRFNCRPELAFIKVHY